jgi:hypothetical protein
LFLKAQRARKMLSRMLHFALSLPGRLCRRQLLPFAEQN